MDVRCGISLNIITHVIRQFKGSKESLRTVERTIVNIQQRKLNFAGAELCG